MKSKALVLAALALMAGCTRESADPTPDPVPEDPWSFDEDEQELLVFTKAEAQYVGDDVYAQTSDHWIVELTDEKGDTLALELNSRYNPEQKADFSYLYGSYHEPQNNGDFSEGTYSYGEVYGLDAPGKVVYIPLGTYYQYVDENGQTAVDYLFMGTATLSEDGVQGTLVGEAFQKRVFCYEGSIAEVPVRYRGYPNTNLTSDVEVNDLTVMKIRDWGNYFYLTDENYNEVTTYRYFEILLSSGDVGRTIDSWTGKYVMSGTGDFVKIGLLTTYDATSSTIPEGEYTVAPANEYGGIAREDIVPFRFQSGVPDVFGKQKGGWYVGVQDGAWSRYARIDGGTVTVGVQDGVRILSFEFLDCADEPRKITGSVIL